MFCNQCEQTANGTGCVTSPGVCGKNEDVQSLQETLLYGVKGMAAYANHARRLGKTDEAVNAFIEEALFATMTNVNFDIGDAARTGARVRQAEPPRHGDARRGAHRAISGHPSPAAVQEGTQAGPGILITGHDMLDLDNLLKQCEGTDVKVYTHGEMLPGPHVSQAPRASEPGRPLRRGLAEAAARVRRVRRAGRWPRPTASCSPRTSYADRLFTTRVTAVPGGTRITNDDFSQVDRQGQGVRAAAGGPRRQKTIGFHHSVILGIADTIVQAVKEGKISRFFVIGGCDGAEAGRNYFSDYAQATPADSFILTLGCGKYRIRDYDYGELLGLPRLLDMGQCNNAYGAIKVAVGLAEAFNCSVNDLPLTLVVSWFEQKAVAVLLTLLYLGVKGITIGPKPPAFVSPNVFKVLQDKFDLRLTGDARTDLQAALAG